MHRERIIPFLGVLLAGCLPYSSQLAREPAPARCDSGGDTETPVTLDDGHPGWLFPDCWACHDPAGTHNPGLDPYQCAMCHGSNGAPAGHGGSPPCAGCHGEPHGSDGFPDPDACQTCHPG
ncbi:MAG: hypothetical protein ABIO70_35255 [Pseudomonadota bacterium]